MGWSNTLHWSVSGWGIEELLCSSVLFWVSSPQLLEYVLFFHPSLSSPFVSFRRPFVSVKKYLSSPRKLYSPDSNAFIGSAWKVNVWVLWPRYPRLWWFRRPHVTWYLGTLAFLPPERFPTSSLVFFFKVFGAKFEHWQDSPSLWV